MGIRRINRSNSIGSGWMSVGGETGLIKRWWRVGCTMHVDEALYCHDMGRLLPRALPHHNMSSLPHFSFQILYLEEDRTNEIYDPYGNIRFYIEFHKFLTYFGAHLKIYLVDEFVENTKAISRLLITKRSPATLPLSLKKLDFSNGTGHLFQNQVAIVNPDGKEEVLDHFLHVIVEATEDVTRWLFLHCIRRAVNHRAATIQVSRSISNEEPRAPTSRSLEDPPTKSEDSEKRAGELVFSRGRSRRSSLAHADSPIFRDTNFEGYSCFMAYKERKSCSTPYSAERARVFMEKVRKGFFRQTDLDFVI